MKKGNSWKFNGSSRGQLFLKNFQTCLDGHSLNLVFFSVSRSLSARIVYQIFPVHDHEKLKRLRTSWVKNVLSRQPIGEFGLNQLFLKIVVLVKKRQSFLEIRIKNMNGLLVRATYFIPKNIMFIKSNCMFPSCLQFPGTSNPFSVTPGTIKASNMLLKKCYFRMDFSKCINFTCNLHTYVLHTLY